MEKICKDCGQTKPITEFRLHSKTSTARRSYCNPCHNMRSNDRRARRKQENPAYGEDRRIRHREKRTNERRLGIRPEQWLLEDCRKSDARKNRVCDLTVEHIKGLIQDHKCCYCEETNLRMSLDRIDNRIGHTMANVVACCIRCNMMRGAIPYEAWLAMVPGVRLAREQGLFGAWTGEIHRKVVGAQGLEP